MPPVARVTEEGRDGERSRSQQPPDPQKDVRWNRQSDARRVAARLEPHRTSDPAGRGTERPAGPHRRCRVREPEHVRRPDPDTELHPRRRRRRALQPVPRHRAVLPHARVAVDRAEQPYGWVRLDRRARGRVPGLLRDVAAGLRAAAADPERQRLQHGRVREMAPDTRRTAGSRRPIRPVAERLGLRLLLRDPRRRLESVGSGPGGEPEDHRHPRGVLRRRASVLLPGCDGRPHDRVVARRARAGRRQALLRLFLDRMQPRTTPRGQGVGRQVQGEVRPRMGQAQGRDVRSPEGPRSHSRRRRAHAAQ